MRRYCRRRQQCCCRPSWAPETLAFQLRALRCLSVRHCRCELRHSPRTTPQMIMVSLDTHTAAGQAPSLTSTDCIIGVRMDQQDVGPDRQLQGSKLRHQCASPAQAQRFFDWPAVPPERREAAPHCIPAAAPTGRPQLPTVPLWASMAWRNKHFAGVAALNSVSLDCSLCVTFITSRHGQRGVHAVMPVLSIQLAIHQPTKSARRVSLHPLNA
jgi:hypothetical protein